MNVYILVAILLVCYLAFAWFIGPLARLHGASLWVLRGCLAVIGIAAAGLFLWFHRKLQRQRSGELDAAAAGSDDISVLVRQAEQKLKASKHAASLASLPLVFILGESQSAKTSSILHCGLEPELLAGQVYRDSDVAPTSTINVWFARNTIFIEAGGKVSSDPQLWMRMLRLTRPGRLSAAMGKGRQAPRAALVCCDCERLATAQSTAAKLGSRLKEMAQSLGSAFPVYVLFTKLDRIPNFADFVGNLTAEESAQIFGSTLRRMNVEGVYAEVEGERLAKQFDQLIYSIGEKRLDFLFRETLAEKLPGIYEFPREMRKARSQAVQFLLDLARPTQLNTNPFLRGFYFSGVRAVIVNEAVFTSAPARTASVSGSGATKMFNLAEMQSAPANAPARTVQSRKVPEWAFLPHLFTDVILRDRAAFASHQSTRVDQLRRVLLACAVFACLFLAIAFLFSFLNNRALESDVQKAASQLASAPLSPELPSVENLRQLEQLRGTLAALEQYRKDGAPLGYRYGLYAGNHIYPTVRKLYFTNFERLLLNPTQATITAKLRQLPDTPSLTDDYSEPYNSLKAYLITTLNHDRSSRDFLAPVLSNRWANGRTVDTERWNLAQAQFGFYSEQLPFDNSKGGSDNQAIERARHYLKQFNGNEPIYQKLLAVAGKGLPNVNFNRLYPASANVVLDSHEVPGAFTKSGFKAMQEAMKNPDALFGGEEWVLGDKAGAGAAPDQLRQWLQDRYAKEFVDQWRAFLKAGAVVRYGSLQDASNKLQNVSANASPLLQLFWVVKENTSVDSPQIADIFQSAQMIVGTREQLLNPANQPYMSALLGLQGKVAIMAGAPTDPAAAGQIADSANSAKTMVGQIAQGFRVDTEGRVDNQVKQLMLEPIISAEPWARPPKPNGNELCTQFQVLARKFPFSPSAKEEATLDDLRFFQPGAGALATFYEAKLKNILLPAGSHYTQNPDAPFRVSPQFIEFINRLATVRDAFYPPGTQAAAPPHLTYTLHQPPSKVMNQLSVIIDGKTLSAGGTAGGSAQFGWPGDPATQGVKLTGGIAGGNPLFFPSYPGLWGVFHFFQEARSWKTTGQGALLDWPDEISGRPVTTPDGTPVVIYYELSGQGIQVFQKNFMEGLRCPSMGAH